MEGICTALGQHCRDVLYTQNTDFHLHTCKGEMQAHGPFLYLGIVATVPSMQGKGLVGKLLTAVSSMCRVCCCQAEVHACIVEFTRPPAMFT